jgi:ubiquinone/menaquinone biosynthesis C-methylase UbiE
LKKIAMDTLDIFAGREAIPIELARKYSHANIEVIDLSYGMLELVEVKA